MLEQSILLTLINQHTMRNYHIPLRCLSLILTCLGSLIASDTLPTKTFWDWAEFGKISHVLHQDEPPVVLNMQGRQVVMESHISKDKGLEYKARFFNVQDHNKRNKIMFHAVANARPTVLMNGRARALFRPDTVEFDGKLIMRYQPVWGIDSTRTVYPSTEKALVLEEWCVYNGSDDVIKLSVLEGHNLSTIDKQVIVEWNCPGVAETAVPPGEEFRFYSSVQARPVEYSSPLFPFYGNALLNKSAMYMYRIWLDYCNEHGIDPFPCSFEYTSLRLVQKHRGGIMQWCFTGYRSFSSFSATAPPRRKCGG